MEGYYRFIQDEFRKSGIPNFIDYKRDISKNPFIDGIVAAIEVVEKDFSYESLFRFLKLGITDIDREDIDIIENYVIQSGRRGFNSYNRKWEKQYKNISEEEFENINLIREKIIEIKLGSCPTDCVATVFTVSVVVTEEACAALASGSGKSGSTSNLSAA